MSRLESEDHRCTRGNKISYYVLHRHLVKEGDLLEKVVPDQREQNSWERFAEQHIVSADQKTRLLTKDIYARYSEWCQANDIKPLKKRTVGVWLRQKFEWRYTNKGYIAYCAIALV